MSLETTDENQTAARDLALNALLRDFARGSTMLVVDTKTILCAAVTSKPEVRRDSDNFDL